MSELLDEPITDVEAAAGAETDTGGEVARADEPVAVPAPAAVPALDLDSWEVQQRISQIADERLRATISQYAPQPDAPQFEIDPLGDNFGNQLVDLNGQLIDSKLAPLLEYVAQQQKQQTDNYIDGQLTAAAETAKLEGVDSSLLRSVALHYSNQPEFARLGASEEGVKAVAKKAVEYFAARDKASEERGVTRYRQQIGEIADTPAEPSAGGGSGLQIESKPKTYDEIIAARLNSF